MSFRVFSACSLLLLFAALSGCRSPYHSDQGALLGGLGGAGVGAIVGNAVGHTGAGALIGAGVGAVSGAVVGDALDDIEARNRAQIAQQMATMNMQAPSGAVTAGDVLNMSQAGVAPELIVNHIRANGVAGPLQSGDVIALSQQGVHPNVIAAMQNPPVRHVAAPAVVHPGPVVVEHIAPTPVIVEEHYYAPRYHHHIHHRHHRHHHRPPGVSWGVSVAH
jgi:hypothetical protein